MSRSAFFGLPLALILAFALPRPLDAAPLGTAFTYQGQLTSSGTPVNGQTTMSFSLWDASTAGNQIGQTLTFNGSGANPPQVSVTNGVFTVSLDFGASVFSGNARWLAVTVNGTPMSPRQFLAAAPYAQYAAASPGSGLWQNSNTNISNVNAGNVGIGAASPVYKLTVARSGDGNVAGLVSDDPNFTVLALTNTSAFGHNWSLLSTGFLGGAGSFSIRDVNANADRFVINTNGDIGIGTTDPLVRFDVRGAAATDTAWAFSSTTQGTIPYSTYMTAPAGETIGFFTNSTEQMCIDPTGKVGIGNTAPTCALDVIGNSSLPHLRIAAKNNSTTPIGAVLSLDATTNTGGKNYLILSSGNTAAEGQGKLAFKNQTDLAYAMVMGTSPTANVSIGDNVTAGRSSLAMSLTSVINGNAMIQAIKAGPSTYGDLILNFSGGLVGVGRDPATNEFEVEGTASKTAAGSWLANSDARIKANVETVTNALDTLDKVRLVSFNYTDAYRAAHPSITDRRYLNVIAQEFATVFPDDVKRSGEKLPNGDDILQVDTYPITIYSAAAVQELHALVKKQADELASKDAELKSLSARLDRLEKRVASSNGK